MFIMFVCCYHYVVNKDDYIIRQSSTRTYLLVYEIENLTLKRLPFLSLVISIPFNSIFI